LRACVARYSARIARLRTFIVVALSLALAAALAACGGSGGNAADTVAQPPLTGTQPTTAALPPATSTGTATAPAATSTGTTTATTQQTGGATPSQTTTSAAGATGGAQAGCPDAVGGFIRDVQARGTDCGRARDVASAWFAAVHDGAAPTSQVPASGYTCSASMSGERAAVSCSGGAGGTIDFTASP
jgi:hypothetical protein